MWWSPEVGVWHGALQDPCASCSDHNLFCSVFVYLNVEIVAVEISFEGPPAVLNAGRAEN